MILMFQDIVQGDFVEAYKNLTYKHLMGLDWISKNCPESIFVVKTDDDIVIDIYDVVEMLGKSRLEHFFIMGYPLRKMAPIRDPRNKWFVTESEFDDHLYPDFVSGWFYLTNRKTVTELARRSERRPLFWIDDVFVTGVLRKEASIGIIDIKDKFATDYRFLECCIDSGYNKRLRCEFSAGPDGARQDLLPRFARFVKFCRREKCGERQSRNYVGKHCVWTFKERREFSVPGKAIVEVLRT